MTAPTASAPAMPVSPLGTRGMTGVRIALAWVGAGLALLVALELLLRLLPVPTPTQLGYYLDPAILTYPADHRWRVATGWDLRNAHWMQANNLGFVSERPFVADAQAVALIGDSFVEASALEPSDRPGVQLARQLGTRAVYAMGGPGSSLLDYAERARFASVRLGVRDVVVLMEAGDVRQALCGSGNVHAACLDRLTLAPGVDRRDAPSSLARWARQSALAQYFSGALHVSAARLWRATWARSSAAVPQDPGRRTITPSPRRDFVDVVADTFVQRMRAARLRQFVVVVDGQRAPQSPIDPAIAAERRRFLERMRADGVTVVDLEPAFAAHWATSRRSLAVGPYDGHFSAEGAAIAMREAARALKEPAR